MEASTLTMVEIGRRVTGAEILAANDAFMRAAIAMGRFQQRYDVVLSPTVATAPPPLGLVGLDQSLEAYSAAISAFSPYTALHNQTGQPAVSLPLHWSAAGLPIGVQFAGRIGEEALLLSLAAELETARPWFDRRPPLTQAQG
jgi:Asp-tRNA(Asn)/Glu-tRNA(Gln) amidotransferase A subunit family amidase